MFEPGNYITVNTSQAVGHCVPIYLPEAADLTKCAGVALTACTLPQQRNYYASHRVHVTIVYHDVNKDDDDDEYDGDNMGDPDIGEDNDDDDEEEEEENAGSTRKEMELFFQSAYYSNMNTYVEQWKDQLPHNTLLVDYTPSDSQLILIKSPAVKRVRVVFDDDHTIFEPSLIVNLNKRNRASAVRFLPLQKILQGMYIHADFVQNSYCEDDYKPLLSYCPLESTKRDFKEWKSPNYVKVKNDCTQRRHLTLAFYADDGSEMTHISDENLLLQIHFLPVEIKRCVL